MKQLINNFHAAGDDKILTIEQVTKEAISLFRQNVSYFDRVVHNGVEVLAAPGCSIRIRRLNCETN